MPRPSHPIKIRTGYDGQPEPSRKERHKLPATEFRKLNRQIARDKFEWQLAKEQTIGVDPQFRNGRRAEIDEIKIWQKASKAYDQKHKVNTDG